MEYRVNMFGNGFKIYLLELTKDDFNEFENKRKEISWEIVFGNPDFKNDLLRLNKSKQKIMYGLEIGNSNFIEIKYGNKKITNFKSVTLLNHRTLFPLLSTKNNFIIKQESIYKQIIFIEKEIGLIQSFTFHSKKLHIDKLEFQLLKLNKYNLCFGINYDNMCIPVAKRDTVQQEIIVLHEII